MKAKQINLNTQNFPYTPAETAAALEFQEMARRLQPYFEKHSHLYFLDAVYAALGSDERFDRVTVCEGCGQVFNADYSQNTDPNHDYHRPCQPEGSVRKWDGKV